MQAKHYLKLSSLMSVVLFAVDLKNDHVHTGVSHHRLERILWVFSRSTIQIYKFQDSGMSGDGIRGLFQPWSELRRFQETPSTTLTRSSPSLQKMQCVLSHLLSNLGMRDLVSFSNFLKLMVQQHWITEASPAEKPDAEDGQLQLSLGFPY